MATLQPAFSEVTNAYRAVFGEGDGCPGLVVDKYDRTLVTQFHTLGMDKLKNMVVEGLVKAYGPTSIVERSDVANRVHEGLGDRGRLGGHRSPLG